MVIWRAINVLVDIAHYVQSHLRPYDLMFRYGGEEFLLCMPDTDDRGGTRSL